MFRWTCALKARASKAKLASSLKALKSAHAELGTLFTSSLKPKFSRETRIALEIKLAHRIPKTVDVNTIASAPSKMLRAIATRPSLVAMRKVTLACGTVVSKSTYGQKRCIQLVRLNVDAPWGFSFVPLSGDDPSAVSAALLEPPPGDDYVGLLSDFTDGTQVVVMRTAAELKDNVPILDFIQGATVLRLRPHQATAPSVPSVASTKLSKIRRIPKNDDTHDCMISWTRQLDNGRIQVCLRPDAFISAAGKNEALAANKSSPRATSTEDVRMDSSIRTAVSMFFVRSASGALYLKLDPLSMLAIVAHSKVRANFLEVTKVQRCSRVGTLTTDAIVDAWTKDKLIVYGIPRCRQT